MATTLRATTVSGATTVSRALTHEEMDANFLLVPPGSGGTTEPIQAALQRFPHSLQYSLAANYETARDALTGTVGLPKIEVVGTEMVLLGTSGADRKVAAGEATFVGTLNRYTILGYNVSNDGASIPDAADSSYMVAFESNFHNGSYRQCELHFNMAVPGGSFKRPFYSDMAITGGNAGRIVTTNILSNENLNLFGRHVNVEAAAEFTVGAQFHLISLDTGGKDWNLVSTGSGAGLGAGKFLIFNDTDDEYVMVADANQNVGLGGATSFGTNAARVLALTNGTAPTTGPADTVQFYSSDNSAGNTIPSFFCEGTEVIATGQADSASSVRVKMRINGTVVTFLAI